MNRRLERKVKEMKMQSDEERVNLQSQADQVHTPLTVNKTLLRSTHRRRTQLVILCLVFVNSAADSEAEDGEEADGRGRGGDRASGAL